MCRRGFVPLLQLTLPEGEEKVRAVRAMFDTIAPRYEMVNRLMTFGLDRLWRKRAVEELDLAEGSVVLDLACGTGDLCRDLLAARLVPVGADLSFGMLSQAGVDASLLQADGTRLPLRSGSVEGAISGFALRNFVGLPPIFSELARVVTPGGRIALLDVATPANPVLRAGHAVYFRHVVPRIGGLLSDAAAYRYLPRSVEYLPGGDEIVRMLQAAGFGAVERRLLSGGITQLITATRRVEP